MMEKVIGVLGSTGSIGRQTLDVAASQGYRVDFLTAHRDVETIEAQARAFRPRVCCMADPNAAKDLAIRLSDTGISVLSGEEGICAAIAESTADVFINAIVGKAGLIPTLKVIETGKRLALANKESLVVAGEIVMAMAKQYGCEIIPVDSEHSAIFQSLKAGEKNEVKRILLTASGGPFRTYTREALEGVTLADTLKHPTWNMGAKITVDSATLMNKGFEIIEAVHLFDISEEQIQVVVHPESIIHSAVEYIDNTVIAEMSKPDMRSCIQYAVTYPHRVAGNTATLDLSSLGKMTFFAPNTEVFPLLDLARYSIAQGGALPAVLNAANEVAVSAFLKEQISFTQIFRVVTEVVEKLSHAKEAHTLEEILYFDSEARRACIF